MGVSFAAGLAGTGLVRRYAIERRMIDYPNERSSHAIPKPRGGGLAIAVTFFAGLIFLWISRHISTRLLMALGPSGLALVIVGWLDDKRGLSPLIRVAIHAGAAGWAVCWLGGLAGFDYGSGRVSLGLPGAILATLGIIWCINLYNFMDGLDGLAGSETVVVGTVGGILAFRLGLTGIALTSWVVAAASLGFLVWNWPPARIFLGDVGSGFLGFVFAVLAIAGENTGRMPLLLWVLLLAVFLVDATATLIRRILRGEKWYDAHRTHAYQMATQLGCSHRTVSEASIAAGLALSCCAIFVSDYPGYLMPAVLGSVAVLSLVYLRIMALGGLMRRGLPGRPVEPGNSSALAGRRR